MKWKRVLEANFSPGRAKTQDMTDAERNRCYAYLSRLLVNDFYAKNIEIDPADVPMASIGQLSA